MQALSFIIPCFNPHTGWEKVFLKRAIELQDQIGRDIHFILVNDASDQGVENQHIQQLKEHFPSLTYLSYDKNRGKGYALRTGVETVSEGLIVYTDIDFPYKKESMAAIVEALESGQDVAVGTRDDVYYTNTPKRRTLISKVLRWMLKVVFRLPITDTQCGLKGFNQKGRDLFLQTRIERFLFDMEFIALASHTKGVKTTPVSVTLRDDVVFSRMNARILLTESINFFRIFWLTHFRRS